MEEQQPAISKKEKMRRKRRAYPNVFFKKEMISVFNGIDNSKTMVAAGLAFFCALRISEVCKLRWQDVDMKDKRLKIVNGKNHKDGFVPISTLFIPILERWRAMNPTQEYVFPATKQGLNYYCPHALSKDFVRALKRAEMSIPTEKTSCGRQQHQYKFHTLRHSRCTHLLSNGVPLEKVQKFMRHDEVGTTMTYTWILDKELNKMIEDVDSNFDVMPETFSGTRQFVTREEEPFAIAQKRFARGEIGSREYKRIMSALHNTTIMQEKVNITQKNISEAYQNV